jgi:hypothetical protein
MKRLAAFAILAALLGCESSLSRQNPLEPTPFRAVPSGAGVFENFESGPMLSLWYGGASGDSIAPSVSSEAYYSGSQSLKYVLSVNPGGWGSVGQDLNSNFGVVDGSAGSAMTMWVLSPSDFQLTVFLFEAGTPNNLSCAEGGCSLGECWLLPVTNVTGSASWQKVSLSLASPVPHSNSGACQTTVSSVFSKNSIKSLELDFGPKPPATVLNATIYVDDIRFE